MRYKIGDKVKIKTWEDMEKEYGFNEYRDIYVNVNQFIFTNDTERWINKNYPDRIFTIAHIVGNEYYIIETSNSQWQDWMIEGLVEKPIPINTRWEILDL